MSDFDPSFVPQDLGAEFNYDPASLLGIPFDFNGNELSPIAANFDLVGAAKNTLLSIVPFGESITMAINGDLGGAVKSAATEALMIAAGAATGGLAYGALKGFKTLRTAAAGSTNLMSRTDRFFKNAAKRKDKDTNGFYDVIAHGNRTHIQIETPNGPTLINHRQAARVIQQQPDYNGQNIRLLSCSTGACNTGFAQNLANKLNVDVQAPTDLVWAFPNGRLLVAPKVGNRPDVNNPGEFRLFSPGNGY